MADLLKKKILVEITAGTIVKAVLLLLLLVVLYYIKDVVAVVLFSIVIASAIEPAAVWLEKRKIPRALAVLSIYLIVFFIFGSLFYLVLPTFLSDLSQFVNDFPTYLKNSESLRSLYGILPFTGDGSFSSVAEEVLSRLQNQLSSITVGFFAAATKVFGGVLSFFLMIVLSFYLAVQKNGLENFLRIVTPVEYENYILGLWERSRKKIGNWMKGQVVLGIVVGVLVFLGLSILRIEYALTFALLAAVFELIPIFGPILASIPAIIVAFFQSPTLALAAIGLYVIIQQFENHLIYPLVVRKIIGLPPIMVILAIIIGAKLGGFFGVLLAVPMATVLREFLNDAAAKKHTLSQKSR
ncbi:MAG: hypothetical protein COT67_00405 [Candidatus Tagabacteria bacterium CG09_land_8_20_14_0_10_41_14]|uniref:AI-2E family transporter n=2 Tax=Candidatus Tagaibacteriota TaxID=1817918 RepID=A0A2H0WM37_9BACT|nr:MAG: hypothetical protein COT67_00405 [Candidatus Tagabacteria bacterium CG09_land_8_20_14_0_10_41_14]PJE72818.1 MAG: hypothetical protein COV00_03235 [Candidatus Tagabacteria bacterium CG10_big_fil_rev_8_21_14_0_10_40_13]